MPFVKIKTNNNELWRHSVMSYNEYERKLNEMYDEIYRGGVCSSYEECKSDCKYSLNFYRARIGKKYGQNIPKILIVGKEAVFPKDYNGEKVSFKVEELCTMKDAGYNDHYLRTFYSVAKLLLDDSEMPKSYLKSDMVMEKYEELRHCFAMTNYYKCVFTDDTKRSDKNTSEKMEKNCAEILLKEIEILKPDIVILQGKNHVTFWDKLEWEVVGTPQTTNIQCEKGTRSYNQGLYCAKLNEHKFYLIDSYHPTSHGIWANEKVFCAFNDILQKARSEYAIEKASL